MDDLTRANILEQIARENMSESEILRGFINYLPSADLVEIFDDIIHTNDLLSVEEYQELSEDLGLC